MSSTQAAVAERQQHHEKARRLVKALAKKKYASARNAIADGANPDALDGEGWTPLLRVAARGDVAGMALLLEAGATLEAKTPGIRSHALTALAIAVEHGHKSAVEHLIRVGAKVNPNTAWRRTPLIVAAEKGHDEIVKVLLAAGADLNVRDPRGHHHKGYTPLMWAIHGRHTAVVERLLEAGALPSPPKTDRPPEEATSLILAARQGDTALMKKLLAAGAEVDDRGAWGYTAMSLASEEGNMEAIKVLLDAKANVNTQDDQGLTPLHKAAMHRKKDVVKALIAAGAEDIQDKAGKTALMVNSARDRSPGGDKTEEAIARVLLLNGSNPHAKSNSGEPTLFAVMFESPGAVKLLLDAGVSPNLLDQRGKTALEAAIRHGRSSTVQALLDAGADAELKDKDGLTALAATAGGFHTPFDDGTTLLVKAGANVNVEDEDGLTPLMAAAKAQYANDALVCLLLEKGANAQAKDKHGHTVLDHAETKEWDSGRTAERRERIRKMLQHALQAAAATEPEGEEPEAVGPGE